VSARADTLRPAAVSGLVWTLVRTDFKMRYQPTVGGFVWALLKPLAMFAVLMGVFSFIFGGDPVYRYNLILGLFLWEFFAEATRTGLVALQTKGYLLNKVKFPAWVFVVTSASNALVTLAVFCTAMTLFLTLTGRPPAAAGIGLFVLYMLQYALIVTGISLAASVLFLRYRDLNQVWDVAIQAGFFVAPIIYPLSIMPERYHFYLYLWPPTPIIQFSRAVLVDHAVPTLRAHGFLAIETLVILAAGILIFRAFSPRVAEYL